LSSVYRARLKIGANDTECENAGIVADNPLEAAAQAICEILPSVRVTEVSEFPDTGNNWKQVYP
jgi:hypothetical protein